MVIAIISILISLLIIVIGNATGLSKTNICKNYQRQLIVATVSYQNENNTNPPALSYAQEDDLMLMRAWDEEVILWQYLDKQAKRMICPEYESTTESTSGYNYNTSFIGDEEYLFADAVKGVSISNCKHPTHCALFGDCAKNKFMRAPEYDAIYDPFTSPETRCAGMQAFRHSGNTVVGWLDGHISTQNYLFNNCNNKSNIGFLSSNNSVYDPRILNIN